MFPGQFESQHRYHRFRIPIRKFPIQPEPCVRLLHPSELDPRGCTTYSIRSRRFSPIRRKDGSKNRRDDHERGLRSSSSWDETLGSKVACSERNVSLQTIDEKESVSQGCLRSGNNVAIRAHVSNTKGSSRKQIERERKRLKDRERVRCIQHRHHRVISLFFGMFFFFIFIFSFFLFFRWPRENKKIMKRFCEWFVGCRGVHGQRTPRASLVLARPSVRWSNLSLPTSLSLLSSLSISFKSIFFFFALNIRSVEHGSTLSR